MEPQARQWCRKPFATCDGLRVRYTVSQKFWTTGVEFTVTGADGNELGTVSGDIMYADGTGYPQLEFRDSNKNRYAKIARYRQPVSNVGPMPQRVTIDLEGRQSLNLRYNAGYKVYDGNKPIYDYSGGELIRLMDKSVVATISRDVSLFSFLTSSKDNYDIDVADGGDTVAIVSIVVALDIDEEAKSS